jgi:UDPglucose 6-dehydrogenase
VPGANVDRITEALAHRMGRRFFKGAVPYGGPCWPRDNQAFSVFADAVRAPSTLPRAVDTFNDAHGRYVLRKMLALSEPGDTVGLLGLAYKPGTPVIDRAFAVDLAVWLLDEGRHVIGWDPLSVGEVRRVMGDRMQYADTPEACLRASDLAIITIPMPELATVDWSAAHEATLVDCWRCLPPAAAEAAREYVALGRGPVGDVAGWLDKVAGDHFRLLTS